MKKSIPTTQTPENITAVLEILSDIPSLLESLSDGLSAEQLREPLGEGERSVTENMAHIINCEARSADYIYSALLLKEPLMLKIHPERQWGKLLRYDQFEFAELLAYFVFRRRALLRVLSGLTERQWQRVVREENKQRQESVYWQARGTALHELEHVKDMERKLADR